MIEISDIPGVAFERGSVVLLARVVYVDGQQVSPSEINGLSYQIDTLDPCHAGLAEPVAGHPGVAVDPLVALYETLQTGAAWNVDSTGYNFRHEIDVSANPAFPTAGRIYRVRYELTPVSGQPIVVRFSIKVV